MLASIGEEGPHKNANCHVRFEVTLLIESQLTFTLSTSDRKATPPIDEVLLCV